MKNEDHDADLGLGSSSTSTYDHKLSQLNEYIDQLLENLGTSSEEEVSKVLEQQFTEMDNANTRFNLLNLQLNDLKSKQEEYLGEFQNNSELRLSLHRKASDLEMELERVSTEIQKLDTDEKELEDEKRRAEKLLAFYKNCSTDFELERSLRSESFEEISLKDEKIPLKQRILGRFKGLNKSISSGEEVLDRKRPRSISQCNLQTDSYSAAHSLVNEELRKMRTHRKALMDEEKSIQNQLNNLENELTASIASEDRFNIILKDLNKEMHAISQDIEDWKWEYSKRMIILENISEKLHRQGINKYDKNDCQ